MEEDIKKEIIMSKLDWAISYINKIIERPDIATSEANMELLLKGLKDIEKDVKEY